VSCRADTPGSPAALGRHRRQAWVPPKARRRLASTRTPRRSLSQSDASTTTRRRQLPARRTITVSCSHRLGPRQKLRPPTFVRRNVVHVLQRQSDVVETVQQAVLYGRVDVERRQCVAFISHGLALQVDSEL